MKLIRKMFAATLLIISVNASALTSQELTGISIKIDSIREFASKQIGQQTDRSIQKEWMYITAQLSSSVLSYKVAALELAIIEKQCNVAISKLVFPLAKQSTNTEAFNASLLFSHLSNKRFIQFLEKMGEIDQSQPYNVIAQRLEAAQENATPYLEKLAQKYTTQ